MKRADDCLLVTSGRANPELGREITQLLGVPNLDAGLKTFSSGEVYCRYGESIRGADLFIIQPISSCQELTTNDALMELLIMIDAARGASARQIVAVIPWLGYSRQDKKSSPREPISARLVANLLEVAGVDRVVSMDLHAGQLQGFFQKPMDHLTALPLLTGYAKEHLTDQPLVIVAPDAGRVKFVRKFAQELNAPYALLEKTRKAHQEAESGYVIGEVEGMRAIIVDDIIDTGGTLAASAETILREGATEVHALATHGILSGPAYERIANSELKGVVVTNTVQLAPGAPEKIKMVSCAEMLANSIRSIFEGTSLSQLFAGENQIF